MVIRRVRSGGERFLVKLTESPFYAPGGGQVADEGTIECEDGDCVARVRDVFRIGEDQALEVELAHVSRVAMMVWAVSSLVR